MLEVIEREIKDELKTLGIFEDASRRILPPDTHTQRTHFGPKPLVTDADEVEKFLKTLEHG